MDRLALSGLVLAVAGIAGLLVSETVGTAYAARNGDRTYLFAITTGPTLDLIHASENSHVAARRRMACLQLVAIGDVRFGLECRERASKAFSALDSAR